MGYMKAMRIHWRTIVFLLTPLVFLPIAVVRPTQDRNMLILASLMVAASVEKCNIHRRISLSDHVWFHAAHVATVDVDQKKHPCLHRGFLLCGFLCTLTRLKCFFRKLSRKEDNVDEADEDTAEEIAAEESSLRQELTTAQRRKNELFRKGLCLSIAYACNVGGSATLIGTGTNMVFKVVSDEIFSSHGVENPITFASWFAFWLPASFIGLIVAWVWLQLQYSGLR
ncbi:hypothetical protein NP493_1430g00003 [Ridgeia piscesae]|uniref:Citrate transporter-like domain-containing protein n=1 Tax=Ridgeia piscesae TaxID=27915 RepID=A0AAD9K3I1_RIDPI|nr:hypothetical protein NP493_1430g00003 [Ridgeia piscesae]